MRNSTELGIEIMIRCAGLTEEELEDFLVTAVVIYTKLLYREHGKEKTATLLNAKIKTIDD